nr:hypothetical protein [Tanacetum cinerariifolium]
MPVLDQPQDHLSTPPRKQTSDPNAPVFEHGQSSDPITASFSRSHETDAGPFTNEQKKLFKDVVRKLVKKVKSLEVKLKTKRRKMVVSDSNQEEGEKTFKQMEDDRLGEEAAKWLHDEEQAQVDKQRAELQRRRQQEVLDLAMYYTKADWIHIMAQVEANSSLSKTMLGDDVTKDNFPSRMAALINRKKQALAEKLAKEWRNRPMTQAQQRTYLRKFVKNQSCAVY